MRRTSIVAATVTAVLIVGTTVACSGAGKATPEREAGRAPALTVEVAPPATESWPRVIQASGPIAAWQETVVTPETGGLKVVELAVDVGAQVRRGQLLARLSEESLRNEERKQMAAVLQARAALSQAKSNQQRATIAEGSGALSAQRMEEYRFATETKEAELAGAQADLDAIRLRLTQTRILAADDGIVTSRNAILGNVVSPGTELFRLIRHGRVEWRPELDAQQIASVTKGRAVYVGLPDGQDVRGFVRLVEPTLSLSTGRGLAHVDLPKDSGARPGMFANGTIELEDSPALTLPATAVVLRDGRSYVYVVGDENRVTSLLVTAGRRRGNRVEISGDVPLTARIVVAGGAFLADGVRVNVLDPAPAMAHGTEEGKR